LIFWRSGIISGQIKANSKHKKRRKTKGRKMTITKTLSSVTRGADITKPELSLQYVVAATVGVAVLMLAWRMGGLIFNKGSTLVQGHIPGTATPDYRAALGIV